MKIKKHFLPLFFLIINVYAQNPVLVGYWQNWNDAAAPYIPLDQIDSRYNVICVSFAVPTSPSDMQMLFVPDGVSQETFITQIQTLRNQGKKVLLSIGGANTSIGFTDISQREIFVSSMGELLNLYHFDGIDIDIEHGDAILAQGTISSPTSGDNINLIYALNQIKSNYYNHFNTKMLLSFAPETAYVQGGMSAYGGIWGGYLPILDTFRNDIDFIHVQLYNSGSMYGIDGNIYNQGTADFILAMTEAMIQGFDTAGGNFEGFPASKIIVGLPACQNAAGGGFTPTATVESAIKYLRGTGPKPGNYTLLQSYPDLGGMMTWSINWDKVTTCNASAYEYAANFENIFGTALATTSIGAHNFELYPNPVTNQLFVKTTRDQSGLYKIYDLAGKLLLSGTAKSGFPIETGSLSSGIYLLKFNTFNESENFKFVKQ